MRVWFGFGVLDRLTVAALWSNKMDYWTTNRQCAMLKTMQDTLEPVAGGSVRANQEVYHN